jgi:hypothetical protein
MTGFTLMPQSVVDDDAEIRGWVGRAVRFGTTLPPKAPKPKPKPKAAAKTKGA